MRGLTISAHGGLDRLELRDDLPDPELMRETDVRVRVKAAALNHLDLFVVAGMPGITITPPFVVGSDGMGIVDQVGSAVTDVTVGDTVIINPGISDRTCDDASSALDPGRCAMAIATAGRLSSRLRSAYVLEPSSTRPTSRIRVICPPGAARTTMSSN